MHAERGPSEGLPTVTEAAPALPARHPVTAQAWEWLQSRTVQELPVVRRDKIAATLMELDAELWTTPVAVPGPASEPADPVVSPAEPPEECQACASGVPYAFCTCDLTPPADPSVSPADTPGWTNATAKPVEQTSAGVCGMHGLFVGRACPKCVTQPKGLS